MDVRRVHACGYSPIPPGRKGRAAARCESAGGGGRGGHVICGVLCPGSLALLRHRTSDPASSWAQARQQYAETDASLSTAAKAAGWVRTGQTLVCKLSAPTTAARPAAQKGKFDLAELWGRAISDADGHDSTVHSGRRAYITMPSTSKGSQDWRLPSILTPRASQVSCHLSPLPAARSPSDHSRRPTGGLRELLCVPLCAAAGHSCRPCHRSRYRDQPHATIPVTPIPVSGAWHPSPNAGEEGHSSTAPGSCA